MALTLGDNFSYQGAKPLDARLTYNTLAAMKAVADATMYEGCLAYCTATGKTYQWKSTNTVDETLGKWREFESGGSGGTSDYNDLENLPKINNVEVKGNLTTEDLGIDIPETDGAIDLSKFKAPGTAGQVEGHIYSTDETVVGKWIDGKPIYEKTIVDTSGSTPGTFGTPQPKNIEIGAPIDTVVNSWGKLHFTSAWHDIPQVPVSGVDYQFVAFWIRDNTATLPNTIAVSVGDTFKNCPIYVTVQYTKTTD